jgi:hypothetical protein
MPTLSPPPPDWALHRTAPLYLPQSVSKAMTKEQREIERQNRGKLFSNWAPAGMRVRGGALDRDHRRASHQLLKWMGRNCPLDAAIISAYINALIAFTQPAWVEGKQLGYRVVHQRFNDPNFQPDEDEQRDIDRRCKEMVHRIQHTTRPACNSFEEFMSWTVEDRLTIDRSVMVKVPNRDGRPVSYHMLPGATVKPRFWYLRDYIAKWGPQDPIWYDEQRSAERLSQELYDSGIRTPDYKVIDLATAAYVQVLDDNTLGGAWKERDISVRIVRRFADMDESLYGFSPVEQSLDVSYLYNSAWNYQKQLFQTTWPEALLVMHGDFNPEGLEAFRNDVLGQHGNSQRLPVIAGGPKGETDVTLVNLRNTPTDMLFDELLKFMTALKCSFFRVHPSIINFASEAGGTDNGLPQDRNYIIQQANEEGVRNELRRFFAWMTKEIIEPWYDDLVCIPEGLDMVPYDVMVDRELKEYQGGLKGKDEARANLGMGPSKDVLPGINLGKMTGSQVDVAWIGTIQAQQAMQVQQGAQMNPPGMAQPDQQQAGGDYGAPAQMPQGPPPPGSPPQPDGPTAQPAPQQAPPPQGAPAPGAALAAVAKSLAPYLLTEDE